MTLQDLLNTDVSAAGEWLRQGFAWWTGELADLVPAGWRRRRGGDRTVAEMAAEGDTIRLWRGGRFSERRPGDAGRPRPADLGLSPATVLEREITLPALGLSDLKRMVANDLDRLTPFKAEEVYFDLELISPPANGWRTARLCVIERADAESALERARLYGVAPSRMGVMAQDRTLRFDFLGALRAAGRGGRPDYSPFYWWAAVAVLIAVNLAVLVFKDMDDIGALRQTVDLQRPTVALALTVRQRVEAESASRNNLLARRWRNEPLRILDAATRSFPAPQWVQRLEWNGRLVRLIGYRDPGFDVLTAVRASKVLANPRTITSSDAVVPGARPSFDLVAEPAGEPHR